MRQRLKNRMEGKGDGDQGKMAAEETGQVKDKQKEKRKGKEKEEG